MKKTVLIVYAHQSAGSFNAAAKNVALDVFSAPEYEVEVSDLYAMNFKATATAEDIIGDVKDSEHFRYAEETELALQAGKLSADITKEHGKLSQAELVIFQFPMYWFSFPAIMKGWIDRVLTKGYAFSEKKRYSQGVFKDKKAILSFTTGSQELMFGSNGINGDMNVTLWPMQNGILNYCGFQVLAPQIFWAPSRAPAELRTSMLEKWRVRLQGLLSEAPLSFTPLDCFDEEKGYVLKPEVSHHDCKEGHFWSLQWEEVGTASYQGHGPSLQERSPALLIAESQKDFKI
uniref:Ribosyldihydronicotinamide dehydrogenase [quinone] n=1 Tax=Takifugu rubripes TaxID=31033 RepID=A0A674NQ36_TAKRU